MAPSPLKGIITPLLTPLSSGLEMDSPALGRIIDHVISGGVSGIFLLGSTGEGPALPLKERKQILQEGVKWIAGRVTSLVNISSASYRESIEMARLAGDAGADFVVLSPPFYFGMKQLELEVYFTRIAGHSPLPLLLYNAPEYTGLHIGPRLVEKLESHRNIAGIKDSSGDMSYIKELSEKRRDSSFSLLIGPELLLGKSLLLGCDGGVCGGSNLYPELYVSYYRAATGRDRHEMDKLEKVLGRIQKELYDVATSPMGIVIGLKYLLSRRGLCKEALAMPVHKTLSPEQTRILDNLDKELEVL